MKATISPVTIRLQQDDMSRSLSWLRHVGASLSERDQSLSRDNSHEILLACSVTPSVVTSTVESPRFRGEPGTWVCSGIVPV
ncbi:hypothetical protein Taro_045002 [Colocasia esculenta]|uniref:Uncharacterized protein n=1 Tax=Colocasia esculenta TaxID=4460 RepID=A0A843WQ44_COLES|nr:hypothetical protein [Colocasia esculenta]